MADCLIAHMSIHSPYTVFVDKNFLREESRLRIACLDAVMRALKCKSTCWVLRYARPTASVRATLHEMQRRMRNASRNAAIAGTVVATLRWMREIVAGMPGDRARGGSNSKVVRCPACAGEAPWEPNPWRPFCSERCRLTDLGAWAAAKSPEWYRVPGRSLTIPSRFQDSENN